MTTELKAGDAFPDFELPDHRDELRRLSRFTRPSPLDERLGFDDGYPLILVFGRGFFCPRDGEQMRGLYPPRDSGTADRPGGLTLWTMLFARSAFSASAK